MLLSFSVENYRSFKEEQTLNLIASRRLGASPDSPHCFSVPGTEEYALRIAAIYGANGSGKTNFVRAMNFMRRLVRIGTAPGQRISFKPFLLDSQTSSKPGSFEMQFVEGGEVFRYGFCCDAERVHEEWLSVYEGKKEHAVFSRSVDEKGTVIVDLGPTANRASMPAKIKALAEVGARHNQLFLTEVINLDDPEAQGLRFQRVINWFSSTLSIIKADASFTGLARVIATDKGFADFAGRFLNEAQTGIAGIETQAREIPISEVKSLLPPFAGMERIFDNLGEDQMAAIPGPEGEEILFEGAKKGIIKIRQLSALHDAGQEAKIRFPLHEESDGSMRLLNLLPALYRLRSESGVFVIDELERSMHPILAHKFIEFFLKAVPTRSSQLVFTTHESTLLDLETLRRDGIWFTEKDSAGATKLYSLADFNVRKDLRIEKGYLQGRFGAIPFLGGIDRLIEEQTCAEGSK